MNYLPGFFIFLGGMIVGGVVVHLIHEYLDAMLPLEKAPPPVPRNRQERTK